MKNSIPTILVYICTILNPVHILTMHVNMKFLYKDINVESECGKLDTVLMHRPGRELLRLKPDNIEQLLFDAIPNIIDTHRSHDIFTQYLRDHDTHVLYMSQLLQATLVYSNKARETLINGIVTHCSFSYCHELAQAAVILKQWLHQRTSLQLADDIVHGVACSQNELGRSNTAQILLKICNNTTNEFVVPPLPNLLFTRDAFSIIEKHVFIWKMAKPARQNEPLIYRVIFQYHPHLLTSGLNVIEWQHLADNPEEVTVEGGDVAYIGDSMLLIGCGERTNRAGIEAIVRTNLYRQVIVIMLPVQRDFMHLDTVLSSVSSHAFTLHSPLANTMEVFTIEMNDNNKNSQKKCEWISHGFDIRLALRHLLNKPHLIFYDALDQTTSIQEQRDCRLNVLAIDECHVVTYAGGDAKKGLAAAIKRNDTTCKVGLIPPKGLLEGAGGMHCMTNAVRRHRSHQ